MSDGKSTTGTVPGRDAADKSADKTAAGDETEPPLIMHNRPRFGLANCPAEIWAARAREDVRPLPPIIKPIGIGFGGLFNTAEDVKNLLDLDTVPDTIEADTIVLINREGAPPSVRLKYCLVPLDKVLALSAAVNYAEPVLVMIDGKERLVRMPATLKDKRKLRKGKIPPCR